MELDGLLDRQVTAFRALQDFVDVHGRAPERLREADFGQP